MTTLLQELFDRLRELPDAVQVAVVRAILRNIDEHQIAEEYDLLEAEEFGNALLSPEPRCDMIEL